jgi:hypothetical protein
MKIPTLSRILPCAAVGALLVVPACKDDKNDAAKAEAADGADAKEGEAKEGEAKEGTQAEGEKAGLADKVAGGLVDNIAPADKLSRGDALGHILIGNPTGLIDEVRTQATPGQFATTVTPESIKTLAAFPAGDKAGLVQALDLSKPVGCMIVNTTVHEVPVACTAGFTGGAAEVVKQLGESGKQSDAGTHVAHYKLGGQDLYVDELGDQVVMTNHAEVFDKAKSYLQDNMIGRAGKLASDVEMVLYVAAAAERYKSELDSFKSLMESASSMGKTGQPAIDAMMTYNEKSTQQSIDRLLEIDQLTIGAGFEPVGFVGRFASFPVAGSKLAQQAEAAGAGPMDHATVTSLPASSFLAFGMHADWKGMLTSEIMNETRDLVLDAYAEAVGKNAADVKTKVNEWVQANADTYGNDMAFAFAYEPGTQGGIITTQTLQKPGRELYKKLATEFKAEDVLGPVASDWVTWSFQIDADTVDGIPVDRMTIVPGPKLEAEIRKKGGPELAEIEKRLGGLKVVIDRAETDNRVFYVVAPAAEKKYLEAALAASKGTTTLADDKGVDLMFDRNPKVSMSMSINGAKTLTWVREVFPPEASRKIPPGLGNDMSDVFLVSSYGAGGAQTGELVIGQPLIDQIRDLAN